jgi:hypothetical protein
VAPGPDQGRGALGLGDLLLDGLEPVHLAPHRGAVGDVEGNERLAVDIARRREVARREPTCQVLTPADLEVHGEEGHVRHGVGVAIPRGKLDAIDDDQVVGGRSVGEDVDVFEAKVAVRVAWDAPFGPRLDPLAVPFQGGLGQGLEPLEDGLAQGRPHLGRGLLEVLAGVARDRFEPAAVRDRAARFGPGVECGDPTCQGLHQLLTDLPATEALVQQRLLGEPPHLHGPLDGLALAFDPERPPIVGHGDDSQVDVGRQATVQADLLLAIMPALLQRAVINKPQFDRLLHLVNMRPRQENDRDVRLAHLDRLNRLGIGGRVRKSLDQAVEHHGNGPRGGNDADSKRRRLRSGIW